MTKGQAVATDRQHPSLWRNRDFNLLWSGQILSELGSATSGLAIPLLVLAITGSAIKAGIVGTVAAVIRAALRLPAGALADRWNRRRAMLTCDLARMTLFGVLAVAVALHQVSFSMIVIVTALSAPFDVLFFPAEAAAIRNLVPAPQLPTALARNEARTAIVDLGGSPLGGLLFGLSRVVPFAADAISYLISFGAIAVIRRPMQTDRADRPRQSIRADIVEGVRHVLSSPFLRAVMLIAAPLNFATNCAIFSTTVTLQQHRVPSSPIGLSLGAIGVSTLLGALCAGWLQRRMTMSTLVRLVVFGLIGFLLVTDLLSGRLVIVVPLALGIFLGPAINVALFSRLAADTPDRLQARVVSVVMLAAVSAAALAPVIAGALIQHWGDHASLTLAVATLAISAVAALVSRGIKETADRSPLEP